VDFSVFAGFDAAVMAAARSVESPALTRVTWLFTVSGDALVMTVWTLLAVVLLWVRGRQRYTIVLAALMGLDPLVVAALKDAFARARPPVADMLMAPPTGASFPSGHATAALVFYGLLALFAMRGAGPMWRRALAVVAALGVAFMVGVSRVYLGVHFASDVAAGWGVALALVGIGAGALAVWERRRGPEVVRDVSEGQTRYRALAVTCLVIAVGVLLVQTGLDRLL
jgi:membrane-associated phospholipid phosphatase